MIQIFLCLKRNSPEDIVHPKLQRYMTLPIWLSNFEMTKDLSNIRFRRSIVPEDVASLDIQTLDFGDASKFMTCSCTYARLLRKTGDYSCQLVFARTRTVVKEVSSLPRAELMAALNNTHSGGEVVKSSFGKLHKSSIKLTDSQIALHWIDSDEKPLNEWVRSRQGSIELHPDTQPLTSQSNKPKT